MKKKIMLVSSSGGHWVQLNRLIPAFDGCDKIFVTTESKVSAQGTPSSNSRAKLFHYAETISWRQGIDETRSTREQAGKAAVLA